MIIAMYTAQVRAIHTFSCRKLKEIITFAEIFLIYDEPDLSFLTIIDAWFGALVRDEMEIFYILFSFLKVIMKTSFTSK